VGNFESRNGLASPSGHLCHLKVQEIQRISEAVAKVHGLKTHPEQIDQFLDENQLRIDKIFSRSKVIDLPKGKA
jgi:hypothetical protein